MSYGDLLGERARLTPEREALLFVPTGERFSYRQLDERARRWARVWREVLHFAPDERVAILSDNRVEMLDVFFAGPKAGIVVVPLGTRLTAPELAGILDDAAPAAVVYGGAQAATVAELRELLNERQRGGGGWSGPQAWIALDPAGKANGCDSSFDELAGLVEAGKAWRNVRRDPEDLHALLYTSGTTGAPKGVMIPHRMVVWNGLNTMAGWGLRDDDVTPIFTPLYHAGGLAAFLTPIVTVGGRVVLHGLGGGLDPAEVWRVISEERCTVVLGVPAIYRMLLAAPEAAAADLSSLRWLISGGAPLPVDLVEAYRQRGVVLKQGYGLTEVGVNCFAMTAEEALSHVGSIGKPLPHTETRLVDEAGAEVADGEVGELLLRGPHVCRGYWQNPEATAAALDGDGWFHTGDLARRDEDGFHAIVGRQKDMFISGGVNVYPAEVEAALLLHPAVADVAVVGVPDAAWGEVGVAFVVPGEGEAGTTLAADLVDFLTGRLARYKIPKDFQIAAELPRTAYGKVVKGTLRQRYLEGRTE